MSQKSGSYDVVQQHATSFGSFFTFLAPMEDRIEDVWGSVDKFEAWVFPAQQGVRNKDGKHYYIPFHANAQIGYYRKQLFEDPKEQAAFKTKYGYDLAPPTTIQQVEDIARFFTRPDKSMFGLTANWGGGQGFSAFLDYYNATGLNQLDQDNQPTMKTAAGRDAAAKILGLDAGFNPQGQVRQPRLRQLPDRAVSDYFLSGASAMAYGWLSDYWAFMQKPGRTSSRSAPLAPSASHPSPAPSPAATVLGGSWASRGTPRIPTPPGSTSSGC